MFGKSTTAAEIAKRLRLESIVQVDELSKVIEPFNGPNFNTPEPEMWQQPASGLAISLVKWTSLLHTPIAAEVDSLIRSHTSGVIEGEGVEPRLCQRWSPTIVRAVYIVEEDADQLRRTFESRPSAARFLALSETEQRTIVEMNRLYGLWLRKEADRTRNPGFPLNPGAPWSVGSPTQSTRDSCRTVGGESNMRARSSELVGYKFRTAGFVDLATYESPDFDFDALVADAQTKSEQDSQRFLEGRELQR